MAVETIGGRTAFAPISDEDDLARWLRRPGLQLLLLHDPGCPISAFAYWEVAQVGGEAGLADVRAAPTLATAVERRTGVRHESPQAIVVRDGRPIWSASHFGVTSEAVNEAMEESHHG